MEIRLTPITMKALAVITCKRQSKNHDSA